MKKDRNFIGFLLFSLAVFIFIGIILSGCSSGGGNASGGKDSSNNNVNFIAEYQGEGIKPLDKDDPLAQLEMEFLSYEDIPLPRMEEVSQDSEPDAGDYSVCDLKTGKTDTVPADYDDVLSGDKFLPEDTRKEDTSDSGTFQVIGSDNRVKVTNTTGYPYRVQCKLYMTFPNGKQYQGSGTLIGNKYVITAGHCVYSHNDGGWASSITVVPGLNGTYKPYGSFYATYMRTYVGWVSYKDLNYDLALLTLNSNIGNSIGYLGYGYWSSLNKYIANSSNYPGDKGLIYQYLCFRVYI